MVVSQYTERPLPFNNDAEVAVLGSLLIDSEAIFEVSSVVSADDFHRARHNFCFAAIQAVGMRGERIDQVTVARELQQRSHLEEIGGLQYLGNLISQTPSSVNVRYYAEIVADLAAKRRLIAAGARISEIGFEDDAAADDKAREAVDVLFAVMPAQQDRGFVPLSNILDIYLQGDPLDGSHTDGSPIQTGYQDFDSLLGGMQRSDLIIMATCSRLISRLNTPQTRPSRAAFV